MCESYSLSLSYSMEISLSYVDMADGVDDDDDDGGDDGKMSLCCCVYVLPSTACKSCH